MKPEEDPAAMGRRIVDALSYMTLATADEDGRPWATPVWYAHAAYTEFLWVSEPTARHSRNLAARPEVGIVIFDSTVPVGGAEAVYVEAIATELAGADQERGIEIFSRRSTEGGARAWALAEVRPPAPLRLYRAVATAQYVLGPGDRRLPVTLHAA
jgi:pyridoxine/pyridoxamine 5'-phosphate oxidase